METSVKIRRFKGGQLKRIAVFIGCTLIFAAASGQGVGAEAKPADKPLNIGPDKIDRPERIQIAADTLTVNNEQKFAEFKGNVKAQQGTHVIHSDSLKVFYRQDLTNKEKPGAGEEAIDKIIATGNVKIRFDDKMAVSEEAVYVAKTQILILSGPACRVTSGNDSISGAKITLHRTTGKIDIEGSKENRVEAIFYPGEKGAMP